MFGWSFYPSDDKQQDPEGEGIYKRERMRRTFKGLKKREDPGNELS